MLRIVQHITLILFVYLLNSFSCIAQNVSAKILDDKSKEPLSYVTVQYAENQGVITNEEGVFNINLRKEPKTTDSLFISSIGYESKSIALKSFNDSIIWLKPEVYELSTVFVTDKRLPPDEIIDRVQENLEKNYSTDYSKNTFFMRESNQQYYRQMDFIYKKSSIPELNKALIDSMTQSLPKRTAFYNETLGDLYTKQHTEGQKLKIIKTSKLYNKDINVSLEGLQEKFMSILNKNVKRNSYLKIKSGLFGTKVPVDSIMTTAENMEEKKQEYEQNNYFDRRKSEVEGLSKYLFFLEDSEVDVIDRAGRYDFELEGFVNIEDHLAYKIKFTPGRWADLKGTLYIDTEDFAVLRIDYKSNEAIYDKKFNMFGINVNHTSFQGTAIFRKNEHGKYFLRYMNHENGSSFRLDRPLSIIEKNKHVKGRRKQNELKLQLKFNLIGHDKKEIVVFDAQSISSSQYDALKENKKVDVKYFSKYNPEFWKGHNIIEPNQAIKEFTTIE